VRKHKENNDWKAILVSAAVVAVLALAPVVVSRSASSVTGVEHHAVKIS
jgi:hypothetical protein